MSVVLLATILGGCATSGKLNDFSGSAEQTTASASPAGECKRIAGKLPSPRMREGDDARAVIARYRAALKLRDKQLAEGVGCADTAADRVAH
jgi:hypothetical protein